SIPVFGGSIVYHLKSNIENTDQVEWWAQTLVLRAEEQQEYAEKATPIGWFGEGYKVDFERSDSGADGNVEIPDFFPPINNPNQWYAEDSRYISGMPHNFEDAAAAVKRQEAAR